MAFVMTILTLHVARQHPAVHSVHIFTYLRARDIFIQLRQVIPKGIIVPLPNRLAATHHGKPDARLWAHAKHAQHKHMTVPPTDEHEVCNVG